jgi:hypothetical protein
MGSGQAEYYTKDKQEGWIFKRVMGESIPHQFSTFGDLD